MTIDLNKIMNYILRKPKEDRDKVLEHIENYNTNKDISLSYKAYMFYEKEYPDVFKKIINGWYLVNYVLYYM